MTKKVGLFHFLKAGAEYPEAMKVVILLILGVLNGFALTKKEMLKISKMPHSRENLADELKIYGEGREYEIEIKVMEPGKEPLTPPKMVVKEKTVQGKYIVTFLRWQIWAS